MEYRVIRPDGQEVWLLVRGKLLDSTAGGPRRLAGISLDISDRKQTSGPDIDAGNKVSAALAATRAQLLQSQKIEALGLMTGGIAHDFNNLLSIIGSSFDVVSRLRAADKTEDIARYVAMGQRAPHRRPRSHSDCWPS